MKKILLVATAVAFLGTAFAQEAPVKDSTKAKKECKDQKGKSHHNDQKPQPKKEAKKA